MFSSINKDNLHVLIASQIEEKILSGEFKIGDKLPSETKLAQIFGVSRNVVRESLCMVKEWGLVDIRTGRGVFVRKPEISLLKKNINRMVILSEIELDEFFSMRILLEEQACYEAALHITDAEIDILQKAVASMKSIKTSEEWANCEYTFHNSIAKASRNKLLYIFASSLSGAMKSYFEQSFVMPHYYGAVPSHKKILAALKQHDPIKAKALMNEHLKNSWKWFSDLKLKE